MTWSLHFRCRFAALSLLVAGLVACGSPMDAREPIPGLDESSGDVGGIEVEPSQDESEDEQSEAEPSSDDGVPDSDAPIVLRIEIEPRELLVRLDLNQRQSVEYKAAGILFGGEKVDLSDEVQWRVADEDLGEFEGSSLRLHERSSFFAGSSRIVANYKKHRADAQMTLAAYRQTGDNPDFLFVLPYKDPKGVQSAPLKFSTQVPALDVFFDVDTTRSMSEEIAALRRSLQDTIVPQIQDKVPDTMFGVGSFEDFPVAPYGRRRGRYSRRADQPFALKQEMTDDIARVQAGMEALRLGSGADYAESVLESLYQIATGEGLSAPGATDVPAHDTGLGGVGFRKGSMPVVVAITDAVSHAPGETEDGCGRDYEGPVAQVAHTRAQTQAALKDVCARVIYVASEGGLQRERDPHCTPQHDGIDLASATGARVFPEVWDRDRPSGCEEGQCCTGVNGSGKDPEEDGLCSLVYDVDQAGQGLGEAVVSGISSLAFYAQFAVTLDSSGETHAVDGKALPDGATTLDFVESIFADRFGKPPLQGLPDPKPNGASFENVTPGTQVEFKLSAYNDVVPEQPGEPQVFRAKIKVRANQCEGLSLDERDVLFIVPPAPIEPPK